MPSSDASCGVQSAASRLVNRQETCHAKLWMCARPRAILLLRQEWILDELDAAACRSILAGNRLGRVVYTYRAMPAAGARATTWIWVPGYFFHCRGIRVDCRAVRSNRCPAG